MTDSETRPSPPRSTYRPAVTPGLRVWLNVLFGLVALIGANTLYLVWIKLAEAWTGQTYQNYFFQFMFLGHLVLGLLILVPFLAFAVPHMRNTRLRKNRRAVAMGYVLFVASSALLLSGLLLTRAGPLELKQSAVRGVVYWLHAVLPLVVLWSYAVHRLAGPPIRWRLGGAYVLIAGTLCGWMVFLHTSDPRKWNEVGSPEGIKYFEPSLARTADGNFIPERALLNDDYCLECHAEVHARWAESAHRFSSFNNPAYLASVMETRQVSLARDGNVNRSRWCAGCHDPVPFFSGQFDEPLALQGNISSEIPAALHAGITCTVCHAITHVNSTRGNGDYTIEEPLHYPFAYSENTFLRWVNHQLVRSNPSFHKKSFLKPLHRSTEFCSVCHKVHLPPEVNDYRFLRGQNHHDSFLLSGVSGHGARSFYYPPTAEENCNRCHMPWRTSDDFGARNLAGTEGTFVHDHLFLGANTALPAWHDRDDIVEEHQAFLRDCLRVDIFGIREEGDIDGTLTAPLRPDVPRLTPGRRYLLEVVVRTLTLGHHFTQGTADSNEVWLDVTLRDDSGVIGRSGHLDAQRRVDPWAHFLNAFVLDRDGNRIDRRNAQDIFVPLYNHQIPPGAAQTVHFGFDVPQEVRGNVTVDVAVRFRKFDHTYMSIVRQTLDPTTRQSVFGDAGEGRDGYRNELPITTIATDRMVLPIEGGPEPAPQANSIPPWMRWNDYGIGLLLRGGAQLRQAEEAFREVEALGRYDGPLNLARVQVNEGRLDEAVASVARASQYVDPAPPPWTLAWLSGVLNRQQGHLQAAEQNFRDVLTPSREAVARGFDFGQDYEVLNLLGQTLFDRARRVRGASRLAERDALLREAAEVFQQTLALDAENATAHFGLQQIFELLGDDANSGKHRALHLTYKPDDNARDRAVAQARRKYPAADHASQPVVIYDLQRETP